MSDCILFCLPLPKASLMAAKQDRQLLKHSLALTTILCQPAGLLFDWLYPAHFPLLLRCLEAWADEPAVTTALLKLFAELVLNRSQRLVFDSSSPNGILLFREVSKVGLHMETVTDTQVSWRVTPWAQKAGEVGGWGVLGFFGKALPGSVPGKVAQL